MTDNVLYFKSGVVGTEDELLLHFLNNSLKRKLPTFEDAVEGFPEVKSVLAEGDEVEKYYRGAWYIINTPFIAVGPLTNVRVLNYPLESYRVDDVIIIEDSGRTHRVACVKGDCYCTRMEAVEVKAGEFEPSQMVAEGTSLKTFSTEYEVFIEAINKLGTDYGFDLLEREATTFFIRVQLYTTERAESYTFGFEFPVEILKKSFLNQMRLRRPAIH